MNTRGRWTLPTLFFAFIGMAGGPSAQTTCDLCTVGVVLDGPWERNDEVREIFERETLDLVGDDLEVRFPVDKRHLGDWSLAGVAHPGRRSAAGSGAPLPEGPFLIHAFFSLVSTTVRLRRGAAGWSRGLTWPPRLSTMEQWCGPESPS